MHEISLEPWLRVGAVMAAALAVAVLALLALRLALHRLHAQRDLLAVVLRRAQRPAALALLLLAVEFASIDVDPAIGAHAWFPPLNRAVTVALLLRWR